MSKLSLTISALVFAMATHAAADGASCGKGTHAGAGASMSLLSNDAPIAADTATDGPGGRLARVTAYWAAEGDYYTRHHLAATGVRLHDGHCAVDPNIIPYGSVVALEGIGTFLAVDTGTAVVERTAAREAGHNYAEKHALVIDLFFASRRQGEAFAASAAKWAAVSWWSPGQKTSEAKTARGMFADEDWQKIQSKL
jgi:3D (Asp-Asp-Asp) domain-containing protein